MSKRMNRVRKSLQLLWLNLIIIVFFLFSCSKEEKENKVESEFRLSSMEIKADSLLPIDYTCDGVSATLPLEWSGYPENTKCFVLIMHHEASPTDIHWYWLVYNIPATVCSIERNETGIGTLGTNSVNDQLEYAPPCSQGPGIKKYTYTLYALSEDVTITVDPELVDREALLDAIKDITISSATMNVYYSRVL